MRIRIRETSVTPQRAKAGTSFTPAFTQDGDEEESPPEECVYATRIHTVVKGAISGGDHEWVDCDDNVQTTKREWYVLRDAEMFRRVNYESGHACKSITPGEPPEIVDECVCRDGCCEGNKINILVQNGTDRVTLDPCNPDAQQQAAFAQFIGKVREALGTEEGIDLSFKISVENVRRDCCRVDPNSDIPPAEQLKECRRNILAGWKVEEDAPAWQETMFGGDGLNQMDVEIGSFQFPAGEPWSLPDDSVCFREGWRPFVGNIWYPFSMDEYTSEECQKPKETKEEILSLLNNFSTISSEKLCVLTTAGLPDLISGGGAALQEIIDYLTGMWLAGGNDGGTPVTYPDCPLTPRIVLKFFNLVLRSLSPGDPLCD